MANRRADYQQLFDGVNNGQRPSASKISKISSLMLDDQEYAKGFFENSILRTLHYASPTVGRNKDRPFSVVIEVEVSDQGLPYLIIAASFRPKVGDDIEHLVDFFGEELIGLSKLKGYSNFVGYIAVNGKLVYSRDS